MLNHECGGRCEPEMCEVSNLIFMEGKNEGIAEGIAEGKVKGELDAKRASAVRMHAMGLQDSMIAASLDAAVEDVRVWISEDSIPA